VSAAPALPGFPPPPRSADPIADDEAIILSAAHPDEALILAATEACRIARRALLALAEHAVAADVRATAANWAPNLTAPVGDLRYDVECYVETAGWRRYGAAVDALRMARAS
jgi:hypothetical protein